MLRTINTIDFYFSDGSYVKWLYLGRVARLCQPKNRYTVQVRVQNSPNSIDVSFETWDKPSEARAVFFIKSAIKEDKKS